MRGKCKGVSRTALVVVLIVVVIVAVVAMYATHTYPRTLVSFPVSFTVGADVERREFDVPILHGWVQVEVVISDGSLLWAAKILSQDDILWSHAAHQGGQTTYRSEWIEISSGNYNFTFATAGIGSLDAEIKVTSKGGFW